MSERPIYPITPSEETVTTVFRNGTVHKHMERADKSLHHEILGRFGAYYPLLGDILFIHFSSDDVLCKQTAAAIDEYMRTGNTRLSVVTFELGPYEISFREVEGKPGRYCGYVGNEERFRITFFDSEAIKNVQELQGE